MISAYAAQSMDSIIARKDKGCKSQIAHCHVLLSGSHSRSGVYAAGLSEKHRSILFCNSDRQNHRSFPR
jgi:hypothetical protein